MHKPEKISYSNFQKGEGRGLSFLYSNTLSASFASIKGFTLIEAMVVIAIVSIVIVIGSRSHICYEWLTKETNYSQALRQMNVQKKILSKQPFNRFPPEIFTIPENGKIELSNKNILPENLIVICEEGNGKYKSLPDKGNYNLDDKSGIITFSNKNHTGKRVLIKYDYLLPDYGETATVPKNEPYEIIVLNYPVNSLINIELVEGSKFTKIPSNLYKIKENGRAVIIDKIYSGKVLRITYTGEKIRNICSGEFLDENLNPTSEPSNIKLIKIREDYGGRENIENGILMVKE